MSTSSETIWMILLVEKILRMDKKIVGHAAQAGEGENTMVSINNEQLRHMYTC